MRPGELRLTNISVDDTNSEYSPVAGSIALRKAVAHLYNHRYRENKNSKYSYKNVAISPGGRAGLTRIAASLGNIHLGHLLPDYTAYEELFEAFKSFVPIPIVANEQNGFRVSSREFEDEVVSRGLGAVLLSNPCNPTGHVMLGKELESFIDIGRRTSCAQIFDEFYSHYIYSNSRKHVSAAEYVDDVNDDSVVIVDGLTKNWRYPGLRLSWTLGPEAIVERINSAGSFLDGGAVHPIQQAAIPLLEPKIADEQAEMIQAHFGDKRSFILKELSDMGFYIPSSCEGSFYCFASLKNISGFDDGMDLFERMLEEKLICVPGEFFDVNPGRRREHIPSRLKAYVRFSYGPSMETIRRGLERLRRVLEK